MGQYLQELRQARRERLKRFRLAETAYQRKLTAISEALLGKGAEAPVVLLTEAIEDQEAPDEWNTLLPIKKDIKKVPIRAICRETCKHFDISVVDFLSTRRTGVLVYARQLAAYIAKKNTLASFPIIGQTMMRDHSTIIYSVRKITQMLDEGHNLTKQHIRAIEDKLSAQYILTNPLSEGETNDLSCDADR